MKEPASGEESPNGKRRIKRGYALPGTLVKTSRHEEHYSPTEMYLLFISEPDIDFLPEMEKTYIATLSHKGLDPK